MRNDLTPTDGVFILVHNKSMPPGVNFTISYKHFFVQKRIGSFLYLQFGFVIFLVKEIGAKAAFQMLVKLHTGVNFINILCTNFLYNFFART
jgi:hypothetical protein